jgi:tetratricopeptide (TPR) repeat protein
VSFIRTKALQAYNDLLAVDPTNAYVHLSLADYYRNQKQNDKAFQEIKIAFRSKELDIETKVKILLSYYSITETYSDLKGDADELCKIIVEVHPNEAKAFSIYGDFLFRDKKYEEARTQFRKAISLDKEKFAWWNQLLLIESELNDYTAMEKESKEAIDLFPNQAIPYFFNGVSNIKLKNAQVAIDALTAGKEFVYDNKAFLSQFYASIGDAQNQLQKHDESDVAYDKALEIDPSNVSVLNNYSYYLSIRNKNLEKAETMSKKCNDIEPNNNSYQDTYGWILYQMKKYDDAKVWIGKALENGGKNNGTFLEHYGDILYQLGDKEKALSYWIEAKKFGGHTDLIDKKITDKKLYE